MKQISFTIISMCITLVTFAQQKEGKVIYTRTMQMRLNGNNAAQQMMPQSRTDKFELSFNRAQSLWKHTDEDDNTEEVSGSGMNIKMTMARQNDIVFSDYNTLMRTEQRELFDNFFIVTDSIRKLNWKLTGETQTLLGHVCQKAVSQRTGKRKQTIFENGKIEQKEINDTTNIIAWFTNDIPVPAGPEVHGQLPGLILEFDMNNGRMVYKAIEISTKSNTSNIKAPSKGKKVTTEEFIKEREKMIAEMQKNNQGSGRKMIRMN